MARTSKGPTTTPYWEDGTALQRFPPLQADLQVDVVIIGGGITGLTAAYLLAAEGRTVALLERRHCAQAETGHTSAHLTMVTDAPLTALVDAFGPEKARATWEAGLSAIARIETVVRDEQIECDFERVPGYFHAPSPDARERARFEREAAAVSELGFGAVFAGSVPLVGGPGVRFERQARFHPQKYLAGIARAAVAQGVRIFEDTDVKELSDHPLSARANGRTVTCGDIVVATHNPLVGIEGMTSATLFQTKLALYTSYVVAGRVQRGRVADALFWDSDDVYHYIRIDRQPDHDVVMLGGEDHKTGQAKDTEACYDRLEDRLLSLLPSIELTHRWSGQVIETPDGLPYIGDTAPHQFAATGFGGNGMTYGTLAAMMACDRIAGRVNPWSDLFDVNRKPVRAGLWQYVKENTDYPYYMIRDRFAGDEARSLEEIVKRQGRILTIDGQRVAAYRAEDDRVLVRSAVCTHMGCFVDWNQAEQTWDCPCHGSRFQPTGEVISGPAESPLAPIDRKTPAR